MELSGTTSPNRTAPPGLPASPFPVAAVTLLEKLAPYSIGLPLESYTMLAVSSRRLAGGNVHLPVRKRLQAACAVLTSMRLYRRRVCALNTTNMIALQNPWLGSNIACHQCNHRVRRLDRGADICKPTLTWTHLQHVQRVDIGARCRRRQRANHVDVPKQPGAKENQGHSNELDGELAGRSGASSCGGHTAPGAWALVVGVNA